MKFETFITSRTFALSEGSMYERLRRFSGVEFDPFLFHATLIYTPDYARVLEGMHREYLDVGQAHRLPMFALTDTWRASSERIQQSRFRDRDVNGDNVRFLKGICQSYGADAAPIFVGGQLGPRGDAYTPEEALPTSEAEAFHAPQAETLATAQVDFLYAATLPALTEAQGLAKAMARSGLPYVLSFVIRRQSTLLDGTPLGDAIARIDDISTHPPAGYAINCVHPSILIDGMTALQGSHPDALQRIISFQANTSALDPKELDGLADLETAPPDTLAAMMVNAYDRFHIPFMGGCCGTDTRHIASLAATYQNAH